MPPVLAALLAASIAPSIAAAPEDPGPLDPLALLSDRCYACHGPDEGARKGRLRLDTREGLFGAREGRVPVDPRSPATSELVRRIRALDDTRMPPADSGLALNEREVLALVDWVERGAPWSGHWSFAPVPDVTPPPVHDTAWVRDDLDRFVLALLEQRGLRPAPAAAPGALLRRVSLDLTGLPPTPEELDAFEADPSDAAYEAVVDGLLASPRYAERMAWDWLDAARYADTDGFQSDPTREMWPWRDWLVDALDRDVPFDRLTVELLAGDLLPDATPEQVLATGFQRNHPYNGEGGRIPEETRVENVFDRVETMGAVWLGLTVECARCHDHKYDPLTQLEYYGLFDFFNQTSESGAIGGGRAAPTLRYLPPDARAEVARLAEELARCEARALAPDAELDAEQERWEAQLAQRLRDEPALAGDVEAGPWQRTDVLPPPGGDAGRMFAHAYPPEPGAEGAAAWRPADDLVDGQPLELPAEVGVTYFARTLRAPGPRTVALTFGSDDGLRVWLDGREVLAHDVARAVALDQERVEVELAAGEHALLCKVVNTGGIGGFAFRVADERALGLTRAERGALLRSHADREPAEERALTRSFRAARAPWWAESEARAADLRAQRAAVERGATSPLVMDRLPEEVRRWTRVLERGAYDQPRLRVGPGTPAFLPPLPDDAPRDRLALARWLVAPGHPLTARVAVNRAWQTIFGRGLVATPEDFGRQGEAPSHPALLDWLAHEYVASGWSTKALHRRLVLSATYRQAAAAGARGFADDPDDVLLARSARHRLPSWMLRDQALALSGLLVADRGGPPVRPYQPDGVWAEATFGTIRYVPSEGRDLYRRSLYVFWRRIVGPTFFFDAAKRQTCELRPRRTNTPQHALVTLNDTGYVEAARKLAERAWGAGTDAPQRIAWAFRAATARRPEAAELDVLIRRFAAARELYAARPAEALALLAVGAAPRDATLPAPDLAALAVVCSVILNLDEVLTRP